jgi:hypothetical protein
MKKLLVASLGLLLGLAATASVTNEYYFTTASLPSQPGEYNLSYISTANGSVPAMLALTTNSAGGLIPPTSGQTWDFSQPQQLNESIQRTDIIAPANGMDSSYFPSATYAEQDSIPDGDLFSPFAWRYYGFTNQTRLYYGSYVLGTGLDGLAVFNPPTPDIPASVSAGQTWSRVTTWRSTANYQPLYYTFSDTAIVDAFGTLILPGIDPQPALRVHEANVYDATNQNGRTEALFTNQYYYWLVPKLGVAVQVFEFGQAGVAYTNEVERMYYASYYTNQPPATNTYTPVQGNLHIHLLSSYVFLSWDTFTNYPNYEVQANSSLTATSWQSLGLTTATNWVDNLGATSRFYRVLASP